ERDLKYISWSERMKLTLHYTNLIQHIGKRMMLRQRVLATAMTYFQRFYANNAYRDTDAYPVACTCLYLAAKVEETPHHLRTFVNETREYLKRRHTHSMLQSSADIAELEIYLLEEMDFYMVLYHPYDLLTRLCDELQIPKSNLQTAWFVINDSFRIDVCLRYPPHVITLAALYMTCTLQPDEPNALATMASPTTTTTNNNNTTATATTDPLPASLAERLRQWFAGVSTPLDKVAEVTQQLLNLYHVWDAYSEVEIPAILARLRVASPTLEPISSKMEEGDDSMISDI
ncbi:cyclin-like protein, partial [Syncephalis pseudoplumigaleata]